MSATEDRIAAIEAADERDVHRRLQQMRAERDEVIAELERRRAAGRELDGVIVRLSEENTRLRAMLGKVPQEQLARIMRAVDEEALREAGEGRP